MPVVRVLLLLLVTLPLRAAESPGFTRDVVPALTRAGCNSGACHGSFQGRGGFRLSLLGFDPQADHEAIVHEARGRRVFPALPEQSLLLRKPTGEVAHGGGRKLTLDSPAHRIFLGWIRQGMPGPSKADPSLVRLEVLPKGLTLSAGQQRPLTVRAHWSDGKVLDVASWALYESNKDTVATVNDQGLVRAQGPGRASLMIRYLGRVAAVPVTVPFATAQNLSWPRHNFVDDHIASAWKQVGLEPAPLCDDATFLRRIHLDLIGTLPTPDEARRFIDNRDPQKRVKLVDDLLDRPEYVEYWSLKWGDLLRIHRRALGEKGLASFNGWFRTALRENRPFDRVVRELLTARGNLYQSGAAAFYFVDRDPPDLAEATAQVFLGIRLACAKCHHHPFETWSQDDYHGLAAFFPRVQRKDSKEEGLFGGSMSVSLAPAAKYRHPGTSQLMLPRVLGGPPLNVPPEQDPRNELAQWVTSKDNPYFARNIVNRYWGWLMGRGLVEPVDDVRATNPASHPALLDELTRSFIASNFDLKKLLRTLCQSRTYQLASSANARWDADGTFFTHRRPSRLSAEVLLDAINQACETSEDFPGMPASTRALSLPDPAVASVFLDTFGRPRRTTSCLCERPSGSDLAQVLHLANGEKLHLKVAAKTGRVSRLLAAKKNDREIVEELYLATLSRRPTTAEMDRVLTLLKDAPSRQEGLEDLLWTLLNLGEFTFNR